MRVAAGSVAGFSFMSHFFSPRWLDACDRQKPPHTYRTMWENVPGRMKKQKTLKHLNQRGSLRSDSFSMNANIQKLFSKTLFFPVYHKDNWLASHGSLQASFVLGHEIPGYRAQRGLLGSGGGRRGSEKCVLSSRFADFLQCQEESSHAPAPVIIGEFLAD